MGAAPPRPRSGHQRGRAAHRRADRHGRTDAAGRRAACRRTALVLGSNGDGGPTAQFGVIAETGPQWHSQAGGRIDRMIRLDLRAGRLSEGALVVDAAGNALGMAAAGPRGQVLVIPHATIDAQLDPLLAEGPHRARLAGRRLAAGNAYRRRCAKRPGQDQGRMIVSIAAGGPGRTGGPDAGRHPARRSTSSRCWPAHLRASLGAERIGKPWRSGWCAAAQCRPRPDRRRPPCRLRRGRYASAWTAHGHRMGSP